MAGELPENMLDSKTPEEVVVTDFPRESVENPTLGIEVGVPYKVRRVARRVDAGAGCNGVPEARVIVFGHSHIPWLEDQDDLLLLNPGSPTERRRQPEHMFALLRAEDGEVTAKFLAL